MAKQLSRKTLSALFLAQVRTLTSNNVPNIIEYQFRKKRGEVLEAAKLFSFENGETPFLPVIPFTYRSFHDQMPMLEIDGRRGLNDTCQDACIWEFTNYMHRPPRYIFGVSAGEPLKGKSISEKLANLRDVGRRPLLTEEVIALCLHIKPKDLSLYCHTPHSNHPVLRHLLTGPVEDGLDGRSAEFFKGPAVYGLTNPIDSPRKILCIPSCLI